MAYIYDLSDTWNAAGTTFFGIKMNVTNSASASGSKLLSLQVASTEYFGVDKNGNVTIGNGGDLRISSASGGDDSIIYNDAEDLYFNTNGAVRAVINSSGNVGIGTSSPVDKLSVSDGTATFQFKPLGGSSIGYMGMRTNHALGFTTNDTERMRIDSSGNVGIGTSSPGSKLSVGGNPPSSGAIAGVASSGGTSLALSDNVNSSLYVRHPSGAPATIGTDSGGALALASNGSAERMRITSDGQILVGTSSAFDNVSFLKFQSLGGVSTKIAGTSLTSQMSFFNDNGRVGWIGTDGTTTSYNTSSDARLKENIANADDASSLIDAIQVRKFDWKADGSHQRYGFVAQELIEVAPEAVSAPPEADQMMAVDYSKLVPMLVKELQSVRARLAALEGN